MQAVAVRDQVSAPRVEGELRAVEAARQAVAVQVVGALQQQGGHGVVFPVRELEGPVEEVATSHQDRPRRKDFSGIRVEIY